MESLSPHMTCGTCGGPLDSGPFGLRCAHCVLSMVGDPENGEISYVAELFPELHLEVQVAQGGFGAVYRAEHRRMRRTVALKFLDSVLARNPEAVALFEQEMISVGGLDHPGIVRAHDAGERDGHWYIIMEFVDGMDCGALVRKHGHLPVAESCEIIRQVAVALGHAHAQGLVHRDVKPGNVMVSKGTEETKGTQGTEDGSAVPLVLSIALVPSSVKILDFGLAVLAVAPVFSQPVSTGGSTLFLGTLEYISPEQIESPDKVDARADLYSLGATLWRLLSGKTPHGAASPEMSLFVAMKRITSEPVPSLATVRPDLPKPLIQLCDAMLSLDREKRPASAAEVARLLEPWCAGAELPRLFTDGPLEEKPFVFPKKNRRPLWAAVAAMVAISAFVFLRSGSATPGVPNSDPPYRPFFSDAYFQKEHISPDSGPRLFTDSWEPESEFHDITSKQFARLAPDGAILSVDRWQDHSIRHRDERGNKDAFLLPEKPSEIAALGVGPEGHVVWAMPQDKGGLHIGRARPDGSLLPTLRYDFAPEFSFGPLQLPAAAYESGRKLAINAGLPVHDGEPRGFAFVTPENLPAHTGLRAGDVVVADFGQRDFSSGFGMMLGTRERVGNFMSIPGLWRFRLDDDEPVRRLAKGKPSQMFLDVAVAKEGVFALDRVYPEPPNASTNDPRHLTDHLWRWDLDGWHSCITDQPLLNPCGIAADPWSDDLYILCGDEAATRGTERQCIHQLTPAGPDRYTVTPFVTRLGSAERGGIAISYDGKRMIITDSGNRVVVVLKRRGREPKPATIEPKSIAETPLAFTGWLIVRWLQHSSRFTSPRFAPGTGALYCSEKRLRLVADRGEGAEDFFDKSLLESPTFSGVSLLTGHVGWTRMVDQKSPSIGRATTNRAMLEPLKFADEAPPLPGSFAFVTEANLPASTALRPGDALVAGSRNPEHAESTSGVWRFRFDNDEAPARLVAISDSAVNDVTVSKAGVFLLTDSGLQRWDGTTLHPVTTSEALHGPIALAADPLSSDLFVLEKQRLLRLRPTAPDSYTTEVLTEAIIDGVPAGLCFSADGKRLLVGDYGRRKTWEMERKD